ncbi:hypothetical protein JHW43_002355 [Diplocarpon mali]|nr:hypothetical protein JHW43_002355 [Diplocarpon mali]
MRKGRVALARGRERGCERVRENVAGAESAAVARAAARRPVRSSEPQRQARTANRIVSRSKGVCPCAAYFFFFFFSPPPLFRPRSTSPWIPCRVGASRKDGVAAASISKVGGLASAALFPDAGLPYEETPHPHPASRIQDSPSRSLNLLRAALSPHARPPETPHSLVANKPLDWHPSSSVRPSAPNVPRPAQRQDRSRRPGNPRARLPRLRSPGRGASQSRN